MASNAAGPITCKAAVSWGPEELSFETIQVAPPQSGEVRVQILYSSLCHTDVTYWQGRGFTSTFPTIFGHEGAGVIETVGDNVKDLRVGDHVVSVFHPECKECSYCKMPKTNLCYHSLAEIGKSVMLSDGKTRFSSMDGKPIYNFLGCSTFCEYTVMNESHVAKVDSSMPLNELCLLSCGVPTGLGAAWNIAKVEPGSKVAVFGLGTVGLAVVEAAKIAGASCIIGVDVLPKKLDLAKDFGVTHFINPKEHDKPIYQVIQEATAGGVDYSFECVGNPKLMLDALESCNAFGIFVIVGVSPAGDMFTFNPNTLFFGRQIRSGSFGGFKSRTQMSQLVDDFVTKKINLQRYISHTLPLKDIHEGFKLLKHGSCVKCVFHHSTQ